MPFSVCASLGTFLSLAAVVLCVDLIVAKLIPQDDLRLNLADPPEPDGPAACADGVD